jgi:hypothetical protein
MAGCLCLGNSVDRHTALLQAGQPSFMGVDLLHISCFVAARHNAIFGRVCHFSPSQSLPVRELHVVTSLHVSASAHIPQIRRNFAEARRTTARF